ncbi:IS3 family transposase [Paenibacillus apiarius]|uniref:IS3 family transposase n=1 Tax=Paenibacillus apiarius TaxID=46240 RepID=UPI0019813C42|nr:IS3 family transposase [Paenibacillus apiarius]MBN3523688.1 IS3 family transposase [Paenibacillus apiarius]
MARKGQVFQQYTEEFKLAAVKAYLEGKASYKTVAEKLEIRNCTQLKVWVRKWQHGEAFDIRKGVSNPLKGRPRTAFDTVEQERDYLKAQVDYLKKRLSKSGKGGTLRSQDNYQVIEELRDLYDVTRLLAIAGVPRASYYKWRATRSLRAERQTRDHEIKEHMMAIHFAHPYFGYPRMMTALWEAGYRVNHKKVWRLMKELSIQSVIRKKRKRSSSTPSVVYPNRLKRQFHAVGPQQKLVTDITYISDGTRFYYLSAIQDLFNNEIVAWQLSERNDVKLVLDTIEQWTRKRDVSEAVLHSDQGFQYTSQAYNSRLEAFSVKGSHSRKATCLDNACIESFFSHLKTEKLYLHQCTSEVEIHQAVEEYIYFYNYQRFQAKLKQRVPIEYRHALAA